MNKKKEKKVREPKYMTSAMNTQVLNYKEYYLSGKEKTTFFLVTFLIGAAAAYLFYGGLCSDADGNPTTKTYLIDAILMGSLGIICGFKILPVMSRSLQHKRELKLRRQFMDLLDSLATSVGSGNNAINAFIAAKTDLLIQYDEKAMIVQELELIIAGVQNGIGISEMMLDLGKRSGITEISSFAQVFNLSYGKGGDLGKIIRDSYDILYSKNEIELEIETKVTSTKNELNMMSAMPVLIVGMIKFTGGDFANNFHTPTGIIATTVGIAMFLIAYKIGTVVTHIEV